MSMGHKIGRCEHGLGALHAEYCHYDKCEYRDALAELRRAETMKQREEQRIIDLMQEVRSLGERIKALELRG